MLYQKMLIDQKPYFIGLSYHESGFPKHRHPEIELCYCLKNCYDVIIDRKLYSLKQGELAIIGSMTPHEIPDSKQYGCLALIIEVGPVMMANYFDALQAKDFSEPVIRLSKNHNRELYLLLNETADLVMKNPAFSELMIQGNLYKIFAYILRNFVKNNVSHTSKALIAISNIEKSLDIIYNNFQEEIRIEDVARLCGYSKSNFCKIFKNITGDTFHNVLNRHRIKVSCDLLKKTGFSIEDIAVQVGFADAKSFCRVFKAIIGITPGTARKKD